MTTHRNWRGALLLAAVWLLAHSAEAQERGTGPLARSPQVAKKETPAVIPEIDSADARPLPSRKREGPPAGAAKPAGPLPSWTSTLGGLAVVIGIAVAAAWTLKKLQPPGAERLPVEVVESLGRAPLAGGQQMQLIRCGAKLLLVSVATQGSKTLTEITDPAEVARLTELCRSPAPKKEAARG